MLWNSKKPEIMNKKQMQIASQISKRKALHPPCAKDEKKLRRYYESKLAALPDVMDVAAAVDFTGYNRRTVCQWIRVGKLKALSLLQKYMIPKCYLIDWLCADDYNNTNRKSRRHIDMLWEAQKWRD